MQGNGMARNLKGMCQECTVCARMQKKCKNCANNVTRMRFTYVTQHTSKRRDPVWGNVSVAPPYAPAALPLPTPLLEPHLAPLSEPP